MATGQLEAVLDHLRRTARRADDTDGELLGAFLARHDPAAFEALVRRHGPMVFGVCLRVLQNAADAEDAFQATFLVLVRRAAAVVPRDKVGSWLHGVAYKTARAARRLIARRRAKEKQVSAMPAASTRGEQARHDLRQLLDRELSLLPEKYRLPVVLCDLEGRTRREVARQLRLPEGTLSNRLTAARQRLADRLTRRGLALSATAVAALLEKEASAHAPAALVTATVQAGLRVAASPAALASLLPPQVATLTQGVLQTMWLAKLKLSVALVLTLGVLGAGTAWTVHPTQDAAPVAKAPASPREDATKKARARSQEILRDALREFNAAEDEPPALRHRVLADMAVLQARLGDRPAAKKLFAQAREIVAALPTEHNRQEGEWRLLATAEAKAGEVDEALAMVRRVARDNKARDYAFQEVATELAKARRDKDALRVSGLVEDAEIKGWLPTMLLEQVALAHAKAGDFPKALDVVERMKEPASQVLALAGVVYLNLWHVPYPNEPGMALLQAEAGDKAGARKTLRRAAEIAATVTDEPKKDRALAGLACAQARLGDIAAARKTAEGIRGETVRAIALATLARALAGAGQAKEALAVADKQEGGLAKMFVLLHVGAGQAKAGDRQGARDTFGRAHLLVGQLDDQERTGQAYNLAWAQAEAGDHKGAEDTATALLPQEDLILNVNIAVARAEAGDFAGALKTMERHKESDWWKGNAWWKGNTLRAIAKMQTGRGQEKAALEWVTRLDSPLARANGLLGVAEGLVAEKK
jgi:RNA polymerase sigma factor (sigma-70 family)